MDLVGAIVAGLAGVALLIVQVILLSTIVRDVLFQHQDLGTVSRLLLFTAGIIALRAGLVGIREFLADRAAIRVKTVARQQLAIQFMRLGNDSSPEGGTSSHVIATTEGVEKLDAYVSRYLPQTILGIASPLVIAGAIAPVDPLSAALLLFTMPIIVLLMVLIGTFTQDHVQRQWETLNRLGTSFLDVIQGLPTLLLLDRAGSERERVAAITRQYRDTTLRVLRVAFLSGAVLELMSSAGIGLVATVLGVRLLNGGIPFDRAFYVFLLTPEFYRPVRDLGTFRHAAMEGMSAAERILTILRTTPSGAEPLISTHAPPAPICFRLRRVSYTYPNREVPALDSVDIALPEGSCTAIIGPSGSGKTTIIKLLLCFIDPVDGEISANGTSLASISREEWRRQVALVPQQPYLFTGTVRDNIRLARPAAGEEDVRHASDLAGCSEFIDALPRGMETIVGENGEGLSAGQRQRIAIARAFLKDAPVLLLDEPTSALDPESETQIGRALRVLVQGRTVVVVAHRLNTVMVADRIVALDRGHVLEQGAPADLLHGDGLYGSLVRGSQRGEVSA